MENTALLLEKQNKKDYAYDTIKEMIITNQLPADTNLVERQLCDMLNLSRTPVRAALQELENDHLVVYYPGRGTVVSKLQIEDFVEVFELRIVLDTLALKLFLQQDRKDLIEVMRQTVVDMKKYLDEEDFDNFVKCDSDFHECYFFNTGNRRLNRIMAGISDQIKRILNLTASDVDRCEMSYRDHCAMMEAIDGGDIEKSCEVLRAHISGSLDYHVRKATRIYE